MQLTRFTLMLVIGLLFLLGLRIFVFPYASIFCEFDRENVIILFDEKLSMGDSKLKVERFFKGIGVKNYTFDDFQKRYQASINANCFGESAGYRSLVLYAYFDTQLKFSKYEVKYSLKGN